MAEKQIGKVTHYFGHLSVGIVELQDDLRVGDNIHVKGAHDDFTQQVTHMQLDHKEVQQAAKGQVVGIKVDRKVHPHDKVMKPE